jgi:hypothetical protein
MSGVFEKLICPGLDCVPVLEVIHSEWRDGIKFRIVQTVSRNVFNAFDRKLSQHLAATKGEGFPTCQVSVQLVDLQTKSVPEVLPPTYHRSVAHALKGIAQRAFERVGPVELVLQRGDCNPGQMLPVYHRRTIDGPYISRFEQALGICDHLGESAFLDIAGEFDEVTVTPPGDEVDAVVLKLQNGTVQVPSPHGPTGAPFEWPISDFAENASRNISAQTYLASVRHAVVVEKETAILAFRDAAEKRIHEFDRALAGRPLDGHWIKGASALIARLRAGLGDRLTGIAEDARGKALDWCAEIKSAHGADPVVAQRALNGGGRAMPIHAAE